MASIKRREDGQWRALPGRRGQGTRSALRPQDGRSAVD